MWANIVTQIGLFVYCKAAVDLIDPSHHSHNINPIVMCSIHVHISTLAYIYKHVHCMLCCSPTALCTHGAVRLVNGSSDGKSGRVEVCLNGLWGTVTHDGWGNWDSNLVCRQLGFYGNCRSTCFYMQHDSSDSLSLSLTLSLSLSLSLSQTLSHGGMLTMDRALG